MAAYTPWFGEGHWSIRCRPDNRGNLSRYAKEPPPGKAELNPKWIIGTDGIVERRLAAASGGG